MAKYRVTYECRHNGEINLVGKHDYREWRLKQEAGKLCPECYQMEREAQAVKAAKKNAEDGLPELEGTEKQIAWAEKIRVSAVLELDKVVGNEDFRTLYCKIPQDEVMGAILGLQNKTKASWWIDNSATFCAPVSLHRLSDMIKKEAELLRNTLLHPWALSPTMYEAKIEATVRPEKPKTETVAEIRVTGKVVEVEFAEKRADFWSIIKKELKMRWTGAWWQRQIESTDGALADRAAEIGHTLLAAGFPIRIYDSVVREKAVCGDYTPEQTRWVVRRGATSEYGGWFAINWGKDDDFYVAAKRLPGSRWSNPSVVVPPEQYEQVLDFAERHGFSVSEKARDLAEEARTAKEAMLVVSVEASRPVPPPVGTRPSALDVPQEVEVDASLRDTD